LVYFVDVVCCLLFVVGVAKFGSLTLFAFFF